MSDAFRGRTLRTIALPILAAIAGFSALPSAANAASCAGNPNALGTSRVLVVDPTEHPLIGTMQYPETLPLRDREVVLTFDDGPLPAHSNKILDMLAADCVKATFFLVGRMARQFPAGVRRVYDEGHTVATHSETHPLNFDRMPAERAEHEIDTGIASVKSALRDPSHLSPFFRIPGLRRIGNVEDYLTSKGIMTWSADFPADDWLKISGQQVAKLAISRLEAKGKGVLLLHDIQARTVEALPIILSELKARGYRVVHVVAADAKNPKTPTEPAQWRLHPPSAPTVARTRWPAVPSHFVYAHKSQVAYPALAQLVAHQNGASKSYAKSVELLPRANGWSVRPVMTTPATASLPIPGANIFDVAEQTTGSVRRHARRPSAAAPHSARPRPARTEPSQAAASSARSPLQLLPGSAPINEAGFRQGSLQLR